MKVMVGILAAVALALGGCASVNPQTGQPEVTVQLPPITIPAIPGVPGISSDTIQQIQNAAATVCSVVPAAASVAALLGTFTNLGPTVDIVTAAARSICSAVVRPQFRKGTRRGGTYTVNVRGGNGQIVPVTVTRR